MQADGAECYANWSSAVLRKVVQRAQEALSMTGQVVYVVKSGMRKTTDKVPVFVHSRPTNPNHLPAWMLSKHQLLAESISV